MLPAEPTVFVVDDDPAMRDSLRWLLQSAGLAVDTYATAEEFLSTYDPGKPGCLVLDVRMPGMSGLNLQDELGARNIGLPVIIITGYAAVPTAVRAMRSGAIDFIEKPPLLQSVWVDFHHDASVDRGGAEELATS